MSAEEKEIVEEEPVVEEPAPVEETLAEEPAPAPEAAAPPTPPPPPRMVGRYTQDEVTMAAIAHGSALLGLFTSGIGGIIVALIIWLVKKEESAYVAFQALQALVFQIAVLVVTLIAGIVVAFLWTVAGILSAILVGLCLMPFALVATFVVVLIPLAGLIYGLYGAIECYNGKDFAYWLVADFIKGQLGQ